MKKIAKNQVLRKRICFPQAVIMWMHWEIIVPPSHENVFKFKKKNNQKTRPKLTADNPDRFHMVRSGQFTANLFIFAVFVITFNKSSRSWLRDLRKILFLTLNELEWIN